MERGAFLLTFVSRSSPSPITSFLRGSGHADPGSPTTPNDMAQLPAGSEGAAAGVLFYALVCLFCNLLLLWLLWTSKEKGSCKSRVYYMLTMTSPLSKEILHSSPLLAGQCSPLTFPSRSLLDKHGRTHCDDNEHNTANRYHRVRPKSPSDPF